MQSAVTAFNKFSSKLIRQKVTSFFQKAYHLFPKSILPFSKKHTTFLKRGRIYDFLTSSLTESEESSHGTFA